MFNISAGGDWSVLEGQGLDSSSRVCSCRMHGCRVNVLPDLLSPIPRPRLEANSSIGALQGMEERILGVSRHSPPLMTLCFFMSLYPPEILNSRIFFILHFFSIPPMRPKICATPNSESDLVKGKSLSGLRV